MLAEPKTNFSVNAPRNLAGVDGVGLVDKLEVPGIEEVLADHTQLPGRGRPPA
jgi:hypothetical protein